VKSKQALNRDELIVGAYRTLFRTGLIQIIVRAKRIIRRTTQDLQRRETEERQ